MRDDISILLVEDDVPTQNLISKMLNVSGYEVITAPDAGKALKILNVMVIHLVIIDIYLPGPSGLELLKELRQMPEHQDLPAIAITANPGTLSKMKAEEAGFNNYITKPLSRAQLAAAVEELLP